MKLTKAKIGDNDDDWFCLEGLDLRLFEDVIWRPVCPKVTIVAGRFFERKK
jgi:hypothetical protein